MIKNILFDLGGVITPHDIGEAERRFREAGIDPDIYMNGYNQKGFFRDVETGAITADQFCQRMAEISGREHVSFKEAQHCWMGYVRPVPRRYLDHLLELRKRYHVCLLSNNNPFVMAFMHSEAFSGDGHPIDYYFDSLFCSYEMHAYKPDAEIFIKALKADGMKAEESVFVDDNPRNIEGAKALGFHTLFSPGNADWWEPLKEILAQA